MIIEAVTRFTHAFTAVEPSGIPFDLFLRVVSVQVLRSDPPIPENLRNACLMKFIERLSPREAWGVRAEWSWN